MKTASLAIFLLLFATSLRRAHAADLPAVEKAKIEQLIKIVESAKGLVFIRNDKEYDGKTAATFMRGKWDSNKKDIQSAKDFIEKAASKSTTTGKDYHVRLQDGTDMKSADYLTAELAKLDKVSLATQP